MHVLMLASTASLLELMSRIFASPWWLNFGVLPPQLGHQLEYLISVKASDLPNFLITQSPLIPTGALHQNAQHSGFGGFPIDAAACFTLISLG